MRSYNEALIDRNKQLLHSTGWVYNGRALNQTFQCFYYWFYSFLIHLKSERSDKNLGDTRTWICLSLRGMQRICVGDYKLGVRPGTTAEPPNVICSNLLWKMKKMSKKKREIRVRSCPLLCGRLLPTHLFFTRPVSHYVTLVKIYSNFNSTTIHDEIWRKLKKRYSIKR